MNILKAKHRFFILILLFKLSEIVYSQKSNTIKNLEINIGTNFLLTSAKDFQLEYIIPKPGDHPGIAPQMMLSNTYSIKSESSLGYNISLLYNFKIHPKFSIYLGSQLDYYAFTLNTTLEISDTIYGFWYREMELYTTVVNMNEIGATILNIPKGLFYYHNRIDENGLLFLKSNLLGNICEIQQIFLSFPIGIEYYPNETNFGFSFKLLPRYLLRYEKSYINYYNQDFKMNYLSPKKFNMDAGIELKYNFFKEVHFSIEYTRGILNSFGLIDIYENKLRIKSNSINLKLGYNIQL